MDNHLFIIARGSTPRIEFGFPFELSESDVISVVMAQRDSIVREIGKNYVPPPFSSNGSTLEISDEDASVLALQMSQADTLALTAGDCEIQIRVKTADGADTFIPVPGAVVKSYKEGVLS